MGQVRPARSQALAILRDLRDWTQQELADAAGLSRATIGAYEQGILVPSPGKLWEFAEVMGHTREKVRDVLRLIQPSARLRELWVGPVRFSPEQERATWELGGTGSRLAGLLLRDLFVRAHVQVSAAQHRQDARTLWVHLQAERRLRTAVREKREYQTWAVAELLCEESIHAAPSKPDRALELAEAAVVAAELARGEKRWRLRVLGYAHAHAGNALKVLNDFDRAEEAFERFHRSWTAGTGGDPARLINEGRVFGLQAALRTVQERFAEALGLLAEGLNVSSESEKRYLLLSKAKTLEEAEDYEGALNALREAAPLIQGQPSRLLWNLRYELLVNLCHLGRFLEVEASLPEVKALTIALRNDLDLLRLRWLEGRLLAGLGSLAKAVECLSVVRADFTARRFSYDAALAALDLVEVLLELGRTPEVKALARQMMPTLESEGFHSNARTALRLFLEAAQTEAATVEFVRRVAKYLRRARRTPSLEFSAVG